MFANANDDSMNSVKETLAWKILAALGVLSLLIMMC